MVFLRFVLTCWFCLVTTSAFATTRLTIYAYHQAPPFIINADTETGLNYDIVRELTKLLDDKYQLDLQIISRPELNARLAADLPTMVLWANPAWFQAKEKPYHWSPALFVDREIFVSPYDVELKIEQLTDLKDKVVGGIQGYKYPGVDELITDNQVKRIDSSSDKENLGRLLDKSVDLIVITRSSFLYYGRQQQFLGKMKVVGQPYPSYKRQILITQHYTELLPVLEQAFNKLNKQPGWKARLELYGLKSQ